MHLVVVTSSPSCLFLSLKLSWPHSLFLLTTLGLVALSSTLRLCSSPQPLPTTSSTSAPHVQYCAAPTSPFPLPPIFHNPFIPPLQHSTSTRSGWAGPLEGHHTLSYLSSIFLHQGLRQKPHTQCCGFGRKIFVKLLPVFALWAVQCDRLIC